MTININWIETATLAAKLLSIPEPQTEEDIEHIANELEAKYGIDLDTFGDIAEGIIQVLSN